MKDNNNILFKIMLLLIPYSARLLVSMLKISSIYVNIHYVLIAPP